MLNTTELRFGSQKWAVNIPSDKVVTLHRPPIAPPLSASTRELVQNALEHPFGFEPLHRALTPDDHITIVFDSTLPHAAELLCGVLDHLVTAGIAPAAVTVLSPPDAPQSWIDELPDVFADVTAELHDPKNRKKLAYLASTKTGRRVYLNRTLVEADFTILLTGRRFDPLRGYSGGPVAVFPDLADEEIRAEHAGPFTTKHPWPGWDESLEVAWLLGTPFLIQVIEGEGDAIQEVVAGLIDSEPEGRRRQDARWAATVDRRADVVIATVSESPERIAFVDLAKAAVCASHVVRKGGRIAVLTTAAPDLKEGAQRLLGLADPAEVLKILAREKLQGLVSFADWCSVAKAVGSLFFASQYPDDVAEELYATPIHTAAEVQRLIDAVGSVLVINDAHRMKVDVNPSRSA